MQKNMIDDVILDIISQASSKPIVQRADSTRVRRYLREELDTMGLHDLPFAFAVVNKSGVPAYATEGFDNSCVNDNNMFTQILFRTTRPTSTTSCVSTSPQRRIMCIRP